MAVKEKIGVGLIGCGNISGAYLSMLPHFKFVEVRACADLNREAAERAATTYQVPKVSTPAEILADPSIDIILNLTIPAAHTAVAMAAVKAGKSVYNEKPLCVKREEGAKLLKEAEKKSVLVGCAPDTFLGGGHQTTRKLIDEGWIGEPVGAQAFMLCPGHESWHPNPEFYYKAGGGPLFDMGPYYLTALINLLGPVRRVTGSTRITFPERLITSQPFSGTHIKVDVPTHITTVLDFKQGAIGVLTTSFDVRATELPCIELYGSKGSISIPDPNGFGGVVRVNRHGHWKEIPLTHGYSENSRGIGLADMARSLLTGRPYRCSGTLAFHVLDIMHGVHEASDQGRHIELKSTCERPTPLPMGLSVGEID